MGRPDLLQLFLQAIRQRLPRLARATYSTVTIEKTGPGTFALVAAWEATPSAPAGAHSIVFDRDKLLGSTQALPPDRQRLVKKICRFHDDIISEVLRARGLK